VAYDAERAVTDAAMSALRDDGDLDRLAEVLAFESVALPID